MAKKRAPKQRMPPLACGLPLPPEEWDFRTLPDKYVLLASEYEYALSSEYRRDIEEWHRQNLRSALTDHPNLPPLKHLREAGLVAFSKTSPFGRWVAFHQSGKHAPGRLAALGAGVISAMPNLKWIQLTVSGAIARAFDRLPDPESRAVVLRYLEAILPDRIKKKRLARVAVLFDRFPDPFMEILRSAGDGYLDARTAFPLPVKQPILDITKHPVSYYDLLGVVPSLRHHEFLVDWSAPGETLGKAFASWVKKHHPDSRRGRRARALRLQWLAAYRLRQSDWEYAELKTALDRYFSSRRMASQEVELPRFDNQREWSEAVGKAKKLLAGDFITAIRADFPGSAWEGVG